MPLSKQRKIGWGFFEETTKSQAFSLPSQVEFSQAGFVGNGMNTYTDFADSFSSIAMYLLSPIWMLINFKDLNTSELSYSISILLPN